MRVRVQGHEPACLPSPVTEADGRWRVTMESGSGESQDGPRGLEGPVEPANTIELVWRLVALEADAVADLRRIADIPRGARAG
ncbi:hypothetical protein ACFWGT_23980, partial [Nocardiopsis sp. NPDC060348]|uniref:hypothetical protein n=1 Tax=Nocardiopsis sp. NPDC060348 TaxID=3347102 RepID=UPI00364ABCA9